MKHGQYYIHVNRYRYMYVYDDLLVSMIGIFKHNVKISQSFLHTDIVFKSRFLSDAYTL